ncbi:capsule biosynthesis protein [Oryzibacter oryziterrae]|uniref:capsule biosynthesis protein n=1 Tax=Oryzibacter oryziterrae TaxID=2766474 RepID=UPI001F1F474A|nr:capsular biosynthesis protein [Oryzibacter oryziterrae]
MTDKHFVFLQGMPSPFFSRIARELAARGCRVTGVNLCFGDWWFWRGGPAVNYRGSEAGWPEFIGNLFAREGVTDLVLLGEQRSYHKAAITEAKARGVRVTVTDFGYLRPDWITLERDGMGGNSLFPRDIAAIRAFGAMAGPVDAVRRYTDSFWTMARGDMIYSFGNVAAAWLYPGYRRPDKRANPFIYFPAMGLRLLGEGRRNQQAAADFARFAARGVPYYLFPLQLQHDFQIVAYSDFDGLEPAIREVLTSFAQDAPVDTHLIVKPHPWDPGLNNWRRVTARIATELGIGERVHYIDGGSLDDMVGGSRGMVTVNSTSGLRALELGKPLKVLGRALFDIDGLTYQGDLDRFWTEAEPAAAGDVAAFMRAVAAMIQIRGVYFSEPGLTAAVQAATDRLHRRAVGILHID